MRKKALENSNNPIFNHEIKEENIINEYYDPQFFPSTDYENLWAKYNELNQIIKEQNMQLDKTHQIITELENRAMVHTFIHLFNGILHFVNALYVIGLSLNKYIPPNNCSSFH
jgi:hypothetical protein